MIKPKDILINGESLATILGRHQEWLSSNREDVNMRANLSRRDLSYADLHDVNLQGAELQETLLVGANLQNADLTAANLQYADLSLADLSSAFLYEANLYHTKLCGANLCRADLRDTNLYKADLNGANLYKVNLDNAQGNFIDYRKGKILTDTIIGYKACKHDIIVTLEIPRGAIVFSINGNIFRTNKVKVIAIDGADRAYAKYSRYTSYYVGDEFTIYNFNCEYNEACAAGIYFFMTREEAEQYYDIVPK